MHEATDHKRGPTGDDWRRLETSRDDYRARKAKKRAQSQRLSRDEHGFIKQASGEGMALVPETRDTWSWRRFTGWMGIGDGADEAWSRRMVSTRHTPPLFSHSHGLINDGNSLPFGSSGASLGLLGGARLADGPLLQDTNQEP